ncbi:MAG: hypothetical protein COV35_02870 [Alphaproteobacteria bacterium CG11_big_fil_rev_8_21_14_0_20_39_49]|nr:MAG: hypothetical protein COV35_02870 [Alphaproteobacteria bacterium CG11_big_fil_rev_8_21_14_0_20_39_49]
MSCSSEAVCDSKKPDLVPAQTKPHYWLYKQGREVWNRWARDAFPDNEIDELIRETEKIAEFEKPSHWDEEKFIHNYRQKIKALEKFKEYKALTSQEKNEIEQKMRLSSGRDDIKLPSVNEDVDFLKTTWYEKACFSLYIFPALCNFRSTTF